MHVGYWSFTYVRGGSDKLLIALLFYWSFASDFFAKWGFWPLVKAKAVGVPLKIYQHLFIAYQLIAKFICKSYYCISKFVRMDKMKVAQVAKEPL